MSPDVLWVVPDGIPPLIVLVLLPLSLSLSPRAPVLVNIRNEAVVRFPQREECD